MVPVSTRRFLLRAPWFVPLGGSRVAHEYRTQPQKQRFYDTAHSLLTATVPFSHGALMKSLPLTFPLLAILFAVPAAFVACGGDTDNGMGSGGNSASAGKGSTGGGPGTASAGATASAGTSHSVGTGGTASNATCPTTECGPQLGIPNTTCPDGSIGGPTGRCLRLDTGSCGWEVRDCPSGGEGGAAASGGAGPAGGAATAGAGDGGAAGAGGASSTGRCGGCNDTGPAPQICIYQSGGPGAGRFVCATQNPCGAAGACACIVGQGTCDSVLAGGSPGYCVCDNGLD
jgi:hypothetical protein